MSMGLCKHFETSAHQISILTLQFAIRHQGAAESDAADVGAEVCDDLGEVGCGVRGEVGVLDHVFGHTG